LLGFGALELNLVYPALAAGYTVLCARKYFNRTLPLFVPSIVYVIVHSAVAPAPMTCYYAMHFTGSVIRTLGKYWTWSIGPTFLETPVALPKWFLPAGIALVTAGLLAFVGLRWRGGNPLGGFFLLWYLVTIAPVLPLRDHMTEYYVILPMI